MKRYFEFKQGTSSKFWEIETLPQTIKVRFGRIGSEGKTIR